MLVLIAVVNILACASCDVEHRSAGFVVAREFDNIRQTLYFEHTALFKR